MSLGNNIYIKRKEKNLTQEDLADKLNVSRQAVSDWERDKKRPELQNLIDLANMLNASMDWLLSDELTGGKKEEKKPLKIAPAMLEFAERVKDITADMYISEEDDK